ncbi:MAG: MFS transporter [Verrucomicrobiota bacterium JB024]|nr:MFS transporter [Verrucomicrobiota bacterium JB024]
MNANVCTETPDTNTDNAAASQNESYGKPSVTSTRTKLSYGAGAVSEVLMVNTVKKLASPVMNIQLGINPAVVGILLAVPRLWDALTDPLMGWVTDRTNTRWGRRKPYILLGSICSALSLVGLWMVPEGLGEMGMIIWFMLMLLVFYTCYTIFFVPWIALGYEISGDINDRTRLMSFRTFFVNVGASVMPWILYLTQLPVFENTLEGARVVCAFIGVVVIASGLIVVLMVKEDPQSVRPIKKDKKPPFWSSIRAALGNKPFLRLVIIEVLMLFGISIDYNIGLYLNIYYVHSGDVPAASVWFGWGGTGYNVMAIVTVFFVPALSRRFSKHRALALMFVLAFIGAISRWFTYTPEAPWMVIISPLMTACSFTAMWILVNSMIADICAVDEAQSGFKREGVYGAVNSWIFKAGVSLSFLIGGCTLNWCGFDEALGGNQSSQTLLLMRVIFAFVPAAAILVSIFLAATYPLKDSDILMGKKADA